MVPVWKLISAAVLSSLKVVVCWVSELLEAGLLLGSLLSIKEIKDNKTLL